MIEVVIPERGDVSVDSVGREAARSKHRCKQPALNECVIVDHQCRLHTLLRSRSADSRPEYERRRREGNTVLNELPAVSHAPSHPFGAMTQETRGSGQTAENSEELR